MDMATALAELGVTEVTLDAETAERLDRDGFAPLPGVLFNSHLWHGGTQNRSDRPRRAVHSYFTRRAHGQQLDQKKYIRPQTLAALSPAARFVLDVE